MGHVWSSIEHQLPCGAVVLQIVKDVKRNRDTENILEFLVYSSNFHDRPKYVRVLVLLMLCLFISWSCLRGIPYRCICFSSNKSHMYRLNRIKIWRAIYTFYPRNMIPYNFFSYIFLLITFWRYIYIIFQRQKVIKKSQNNRNKGFSYYFCLTMQGSGSVNPTNGSGSGRPKTTDPEHCL